MRDVCRTMKMDWGWPLMVQVEQATTDFLWAVRDCARTTRGAERFRCLFPDVPGSIVVIFHAIYERPGRIDDGTTWASSTNRAPDGNSALEAILSRATLTYSTPGGDDEIGPRVRWADLVRSVGGRWSLEVDVQTITGAYGGSWPAHLWGPEEGNLDEEQLNALLGVMLEAGVSTAALAAHPTFRCEPMKCWRWSFDLRELAAVRHHPINTFGEGPSEVMAADCSWFLLQDIDSPYTVLLADDSVVRKVLEHPALEAIAARPRSL